MEEWTLHEHRVVSGKVRERIEKRLGEKLDDSILNWRPLGRRIIVVRDTDSEMTEGRYGAKLYKPDSARDDMKGEGWILSIGPQVGMERAGDAEPSSLGALLDTEGIDAVIGAYVMWGRYVGRVLKAMDTDEDFRGKYLMIHERDVQATGESP